MEKQERRQAILIELQEQMESLHKRRRWRRTALLCTSLLVATFGVVYLNDWPGLESDNTVVVENTETNIAPTMSIVNYPDAWIEHNSNGVVERYVISNAHIGASVSLEDVDDDELLSLMEQAGQPSHMGKINGKIALVPVDYPSALSP